LSNAKTNSGITSKLGGAFLPIFSTTWGHHLKTKISLKDWIDREGVATLAKKFGVNESTVRHWRRGHCLPKAEQMREIKKLSNGAVTYDTMIDNHFEVEG